MAGCPPGLLSEVAGLLPLLNSLGVGGVLLLGIVAALKGYVVLGQDYKRVLSERDYYRDRWVECEEGERRAGRT